MILWCLKRSYGVLRGHTCFRTHVWPLRTLYEPVGSYGVLRGMFYLLAKRYVVPTRTLKEVIWGPK